MCHGRNVEEPYHQILKFCKHTTWVCKWFFDYDHCQVNWFTLSLLRTTDQNDHGIKPMAYHNSKQGVRAKTWTSGYKRALCQWIYTLLWLMIVFSYFICVIFLNFDEYVTTLTLKKLNLLSERCMDVSNLIFIEMFPARLRQLGCPIARGNHFLVRTTMIYIILAWLGKYKSEVIKSLHQSYHSSYKPQKSYLNQLRYKPSTYSDFF